MAQAYGKVLTEGSLLVTYLLQLSNSAVLTNNDTDPPERLVTCDLQTFHNLEEWLFVNRTDCRSPAPAPRS